MSEVKALSAQPMLEHASVQALLAGAIDYAGLFPPASRDLATVVQDYRTHRGGTDAWSLGRLVVPVARLDALAEEALPGWRLEAAGESTAWHLSGLVGKDAVADAAAIAAFNRAQSSYAVVDSVESRATTVEQVRALGGLFDGLVHFVELPLAVDLPPLVSAIREIGACAKIRTGGVTIDAIPDARDVARFLQACHEGGVAFKATAGLHHPLRGDYRLTYEERSPCGTMFGYLNVLLAAAQARNGAPIDQLIVTLEAKSHSLLGITDAEIRWEGLRLSAEQLVDVRAHFALAFGSCSFREPLDELIALMST